MIPLEVTLLAFFAIGLWIKSRTFFILALFSWINIYVDKFTTADDYYLMLTYSTIDFMCAISIFYFGDIQKQYQTFLLAMMIFVHCFMEMALINDYVYFIESDIYLTVITALLILQMIGGTYGNDRITNPLYRNSFDWRSICFSGVLNHKTSNITVKDEK